MLLALRITEDSGQHHHILPDTIINLHWWLTFFQILLQHVLTWRPKSSPSVVLLRNRDTTNQNCRHPQQPWSRSSSTSTLIQLRDSHRVSRLSTSATTLRSQRFPSFTTWMITSQLSSLHHATYYHYYTFRRIWININLPSNLLPTATTTRIWDSISPILITTFSHCHNHHQEQVTFSTGTTTPHQYFTSTMTIYYYDELDHHS